MLFWLACEEYKRETNPEKILIKSRTIYNEYISLFTPKEVRENLQNQSPLLQPLFYTKQVTLDKPVRDRIKQKMTNPTTDIFNEAQFEIYILMCRDPYPRLIVKKQI